LIEGYASRSGSEWHNLELTYLRAANVRQYLVDFLGDDLRATVELIAHGEEAAAEAGVPEGQESESWRVVDIEINGVVVLRL
jgi:outer membrane protein OmpA-like peptidoglycan-associated protein